MKNGRTLSLLISKLIERTNGDVWTRKRTQPNLFATTVLGRKIEVEWDNGDDAALYINDQPIKCDLEEAQSLYKAVVDQQDRKRPGKRNVVRNLLRDIRESEGKGK